MSVDLVVTNALIHTLDPFDSVAEAMAISGERILAVGMGHEIEATAGPGTRVVDLGGRVVVPGLNDSHLHLLSFGRSLESVDLQGAPTVEEALARVKAKVAQTPAGRWISGAGWDRNLFGKLPNRQELDVVAPHNPVLLASKDLHTLWVNSSALAASGITSTSADPGDGEIVRDPANGSPTGILREGARAPVFQTVPPPSQDEIRSAVLAAARIAASKGLTSLQTFESEEAFSAAQRLSSVGALPVRLCCHLWKDGLEHAIALGLRTGFGDDRVRLGHLKLFLDGALGSQTALMLEPYSGSDNHGIATMSGEEFGATVLRSARAGISIAVHAIGDAATRIAIDVFEQTADFWRPAGLRQRIEHVQLLAPGDVQRLGRLGVIASMQPIHATSDWRVAERHWAGRTPLAYAWRSVLNAGAPLAFGSDCPVESIDPLDGLYAAVTRLDRDGKPDGGWHPEQRLTLLEALRAYTIGAAFATGEERLKGSLERGKLADFTVLTEDPFLEPAETLLRARIEATVVGGHVVYGEL